MLRFSTIAALSGAIVLASLTSSGCLMDLADEDVISEDEDFETSEQALNSSTQSSLPFDGTMTWQADYRDSTGWGWKNLYDQAMNKTFKIRMEDENNTWATLQAWISPSTGYNSARSFGAKLNSANACNAKQRVELEIANSTLNKQDLGQTRYYSFSLYIHSETGAINKETKFFQAWQSHGNGTGGLEPPFSLSFIEGSTIKWNISTASDASLNRFVEYTSPTALTKGVWHHFRIMFTPSSNHATTLPANGAFKVWYNNVLVKSVSSKKLGYKTYAPTALNNTINTHFEVRMGAYRGKMGDQCPGAVFNKTTLLFDNVAIGTTESSVLWP